MFYDRADAGNQLAEELKKYHAKKDTVILAMPRGGVVLGKIIAQKLNLPLNIVFSKKIPAPSNPEYAIGAVGEKSEPILNEDLIGTMNITPDYIDKKITQIREEIKNRLKKYKIKHQNLTGKIVILVDDGAATGYTIKASIANIKLEKPKEIIVALPIAPNDFNIDIKTKINDLVILQTSDDLMSVSQFYEHFEQVSDEDVVKLLSN